MTRKHFKAIAAVIKENSEHQRYQSNTGARYAIYALVHDLCRVFEQENSAFDRAKFIEACGF